MKHILKLLTALLLAPLAALHAADAPKVSDKPNITFPADGGVLDVRDFGAKPDDGADDTAAIQRALDAHPNGNRIIYLPPGKWVVRDTLKWPAGTSGGSRTSAPFFKARGSRSRFCNCPMPRLASLTPPSPRR